MFARPLIAFVLWRRAPVCEPAWSLQRESAHAKQARFNAQVTEWLMVADCKSAALRSYGGSNPPLCTRLFFELMLRGYGGVSEAEPSGSLQPKFRA